MKVILQGGKIQATKDNDALAQLLTEVVQGIFSKLNNTNEVESMIEQVVIKRVEVDYQFQVKGCEELQVMTVNHHSDDELLTVMVDVDDEGSIVGVTNNEEESLYTETMVKIMQGTLQKEFQEIESCLTTNDLTVCETLKCKDFKLVFLEDTTNPKNVWMQVFQEIEYGESFKLIQEIKISLKDGETMQDVVDKYKEICE